MSSVSVTEQDLDHLRSLPWELHTAGRIEEAAAVPRAHAVVQEIVSANLFGALDDDHPEFVRMMDAAERDVAEGRLIPHEEVGRRLRALGDA